MFRLKNFGLFLVIAAAVTVGCAASPAPEAKMAEAAAEQKGAQDPGLTARLLPKLHEQKGDDDPRLEVALQKALALISPALRAGWVVQVQNQIWTASKTVTGELLTVWAMYDETPKVTADTVRAEMISLGWTCEKVTVAKNGNYAIFNAYLGEAVSEVSVLAAFKDEPQVSAVILGTYPAGTYPTEKGTDGFAVQDQLVDQLMASR